MINKNTLTEICSVFNRNKVDYIIAGGYACALNGHARATNDVDILVKDDDANLKSVISSIKELLPDIEDVFDINDIRDNVVLRIIDKYEIDISTKAWIVEFEEGIKDVRKVIIEGVEVPYLGIDTLIKSKQTMREIDQWDVRVLNEIRKKQTV